VELEISVSLEHLMRTGRWTTAPVSADLISDTLRVTAAESSDAWHTTSYGFVHDTEHALIAPFAVGSAIEVSFVLDFTEQFDQAGLFLRASDREWMKAGVEILDGLPQLGAVVTHGVSDWSVAPVADWVGRAVTVRASRSDDAVTIRARVVGEEFRLVRLAYFASEVALDGGLYCCAPTRAGLTVTFTGFRQTAADESLH
jgi:regulation of enolase protein 1 (concanavalin A-like superfamily)